jgi:hypothetical protein
LRLYTEPFVIDEEGEIRVDYYWIDYEAVQSPTYNFTLYIDQTPPTTELQWEVYKEGIIWFVKFKLTAEDTLSGMAPRVEIYLNNMLQTTIEVWDWENVEFVYQWSKNFKHCTFGFYCSDYAGNIVYELVNGSDIKSVRINHNFFVKKFYNIYLRYFFEYFKNPLFNF